MKCKRRFDLIMRKCECVHIFNRLVFFTARLDLYLFHFAYKNVCFFVSYSTDDGHTDDWNRYG